MALGLLAAGGLASTRLGRRPLLLGAVLAAAVLETMHPPPGRVAADMRLPEVYSWLRSQPRGALLELPFDDHEWQWWSLFHGLPLANGACGSFEPSRYGVLRRLIDRHWTERSDGLEGSGGLLYLKAQFPVRYLVLHRGGSGYFRENLDKTPGTFELLRETPSGDRVYRVRRGGRNRSLRRVFRDDALRAGPVRVRIRGPEGAGLRVLLDELLIEERPLLPEGEELAVAVPERGLRRGPNPLRFEQTGDPALPEMELLEIEPAG
jgi:hypothetical protein